MIVSKGEFIWMQEKQTTQCLRKDFNLCPVHTQLLCYNAECAHNQITTVARSLNDPPSITGRIVAQVNTTVPDNLVDRELSQQCFTGIELTQPLSWMYPCPGCTCWKFYLFYLRVFIIMQLTILICKGSLSPYQRFYYSHFLWTSLRKLDWCHNGAKAPCLLEMK